MEFFHGAPQVDFIGMRRYTATISAVLVVLSLFCLFNYKLNFGLEFTGGAQLEFRFEQEIDINQLREEVGAMGYKDAKLSTYGSSKEILLSMPLEPGKKTEDLAAEIAEKFDKAYTAKLRKVEFVGNEVGSELAERGFLAILVALFAIMLYIAFRFEYRFAISSVLALMHDPIIILGYFSFSQLEFDMAALAAVLAVIGYSLNDTIVVYDRVRENFLQSRRKNTTEIVNLSINQTLSRTVMTSLSTLLVVLALYWFGGDSLHSFSTALLIGIVAGTYSSIFIAGILALAMGLKREDLLPPEEDEEEAMLP